MSLRPLATLVCTLALLLTSLSMSPADAATPSRKQWLSDVHTAMSGSHTYIDRRVQKPGRRLAVNFDIDNTALATYYDGGGPVLDVRRFARYAKRHGVRLLFNTGRLQRRTPSAATQLRKAGYVVNEICGRHQGEGLISSKQRCRRHFVHEGYTIIANVGNRHTDFAGGNYERAFRLPNYQKQLG